MRFFLNLFLSGIFLSSCQSNVNNEKWVCDALDVASYQLKFTAQELKDSVVMPRSLWTGYDVSFLESQLERDASTFADSLWANPPKEKLGTRRNCNIYDWTSGFFPGSLWYAYELTGDADLKNEAIDYTNRMFPISKYKDNHDIGFMINCSYGNAMRLAPNDSIMDVIVETAENLCSRFNVQIGCIRSWDFGHWNYPVIIDNMMNLDLLFNATNLTGNQKYKQVAIKHAYTTMKHHFRPDFTSFHVVSYNDDGSVELKGTHQGKNDDSAWARGQGWAVYGYTSCYRETKDVKFLNQAVNVAEMIIKRNVASDKVCYWDFDAPIKMETPRDASAAAVIASAFLELSTFAENGDRYFDYAEEILKSLSSKKYLSEKGQNKGFVLMHSVGSLPHGSEIDTPINYADYYYLEALKRYNDLKK
ncbi:glycoside hydrolase family 88 protein [Bacteroides caecigallinarum]|uniref:DUF4995 domain-containing protein n=1 Tax=Bacteroides caecigallinarum TaxID=1411144 RepID=UPI00195D10C2|nr:DUF4995 domain-containing protein [Bacteroides caecigallinarum]MBM6959872.1 glycoside hydrolase family 88 protein [Bacteroides caecigallinarum]